MLPRPAADTGTQAERTVLHGHLSESWRCARHYNHSFHICFDVPIHNHVFRCNGSSPHPAPQLHDKTSMTSCAAPRNTTNHERTCIASSTPTHRFSKKWIRQKRKDPSFRCDS
jgi:hypothetical protein